MLCRSEHGKIWWFTVVVESSRRLAVEGAYAIGLTSCSRRPAGIVLGMHGIESVSHAELLQEGFTALARAGWLAGRRREGWICKEPTEARCAVELECLLQTSHEARAAGAYAPPCVRFLREGYLLYGTSCRRLDLIGESARAVASRRRLQSLLVLLRNRIFSFSLWTEHLLRKRDELENEWRAVP